MDVAWDDVLNRYGLAPGAEVTTTATVDRRASPALLRVVVRRTHGDATIAFRDSGYGAMDFSFDGTNWKRRDKASPSLPAERGFPPRRSSISFGMTVEPADAYRVLVRYHHRDRSGGGLSAVWTDVG
jgi:hypothetical protein